MKVLVIGGTRFFGVHMVRSLLKDGHQVTIATRGNAPDDFGNSIKRICLDRMNSDSIAEALKGQYYDIICDNIAYSSNEVKYILDVVRCGRYILTSSASVYSDLRMDTKEEDFDALSYPLQWCSRTDFPYDEIKRQAECAIFQNYSNIPAVAVRFSYVIGEDDYTKRLYFYVEHIVKELPMYVDNLNAKTCFIKSSEAGAFLAWIAKQELTGTVNAASPGTITLQEIFNYVESNTGKKPVLTMEGETGPYNDGDSFSLNTERASNQGYQFPELNGWIYELLDRYIELAKNN